MDSLIFPVTEVYIGGGLIGVLIVVILVVVLLRLLGMIS